MAGFAQKFFRSIFGRYLILTNTGTSCCLMSLGDFIQQKIESLEHPNQAYNWKRTRRMCFMGFFNGPMAHVWYRLLDRLFPKITSRNILRKVLMDQLIASPIFAFVFITGMCKQEGKTNAEAVAEFREKFPLIYLMDWCLWPPCMALNFYFVPSQFRVVFVYSIDVVWSTLNSYVKHRERTTKQ